MTYTQLVKELLSLPPDQLNKDITVEFSGELYQVSHMTLPKNSLWADSPTLRILPNK